MAAAKTGLRIAARVLAATLRAYAVTAGAAAVASDLVSARGWRMVHPDGRTPVIEVQISPATGGYILRFLDPKTLRVLPDPGSHGGSGFLYPYHYTLNSGVIGLFACAFAAIVMAALYVSGIIIHRRRRERQC